MKRVKLKTYITKLSVVCPKRLNNGFIIQVMHKYNSFSDSFYYENYSDFSKCIDDFEGIEFLDCYNGLFGKYVFVGMEDY